MLEVLDDLGTVGTMDEPLARLAQEAERRRIARDLHDGVVQSLTALAADLEYFRTRCLSAQPGDSSQFAEKVESWQELARESLDSMRQALGNLRAGSEAACSLTQPCGVLNLPYAIEALLAKMQGAGYRVEYECEDWPVALPEEYTSNLYSIVREALTNISKHADATMISVCLFSFESCLHLSIADDGVGTAHNASSARQKHGYHQGLIGMRERAALLGGRMALESIPARGTRIDIDIPLPGALTGRETYTSIVGEA